MRIMPDVGTCKLTILWSKTELNTVRYMLVISGGCLADSTKGWSFGLLERGWTRQVREYTLWA